MSDILIQAAKESVILTSLDNARKTDLSYQQSHNYPLVSKQLLEVQPNIAVSGAPAGKEVLFTLPRYGIMTNLLLKNNITVLTACNISHAVGLCLYETIELRSHNRVIVSNSDAYLRVRVDNAPIEKSFALTRRAIMSDNLTGVVKATSWTNETCFTPFFCSFFENPRNYLDLNFCEQLQLRCVFNSTARMGTDYALSAATVTLFLWYYNMESVALSQLRAKNFAADVPLNMLTYDTYTETGTLATGTTSTTINLNVNNACFATHVFLRNNTSGEAALAPISLITSKMGGRTLYDAIPNLVMSYEQDMKGSTGIQSTFGSDTAISKIAVKPISIYWGLEVGERSWNSGAVSFHNINTPQLVITHADPTTVTDYYVVSEFWTITTINPADGKVEISASI